VPVRSQDLSRITQQIIESIRRADLIVAAATADDPDVIFEPGYADALGKPTIVLNQAVAAAPFDIKDRRAIAYPVERLDTAEREPARAILAALTE
jgi:nucleoside 2-deoxyribosyltransferase